jgi:transcription elongation factor Elf1
MSDVIPFSCPQCHGEQFKVAAEVKSLEDFNGAICTNCGHVMTVDEVKKQARDEAVKLAKAAFKRVGK